MRGEVAGEIGREVDRDFISGKARGGDAQDGVSQGGGGEFVVAVFVGGGGGKSCENSSEIDWPSETEFHAQRGK